MLFLNIKGNYEAVTRGCILTTNVHTTSFGNTFLICPDSVQILSSFRFLSSVRSTVTNRIRDVTTHVWKSGNIGQRDRILEEFQKARVESGNSQKILKRRFSELVLNCGSTIVFDDLEVVEMGADTCADTVDYIVILASGE